ncbi:MAG: prepilin-type N-terminal cleavage/methylation domain-containing protein [Bdellovibrionales bacterium]|nr:prepilin-type N-terminal cleavage/methylation domain-containing protein [Bdellovibrionales bacterium]
MRRGSAGFTLIEVLVALFIMAGGILMISLAWSGNFMRLRKSQLYGDVATLLERKMVETEAKYTGKPLSEIPEEDEGDFGDEFKQYHWTMKSREMEFPDISAIIIGKDGGGGGDEMLLTMIKQMTEYLSKTIKEVRVTVLVKSRGRKDMEFSATQYFIDYTQDFAGALGGAGAPTPAPAGP